MRSLLFVPGDDSRKMAKAASGVADALILDLEDSVAGGRKDIARQSVRAFLEGVRPDGKRLYVRVNALDTGLTDDDIGAVAGARPDGIMLPKCRSGADVQHLGVKLAVAEAEHGLADGALGILAIATETAGSLFGFGSYVGCSPRLEGLAWGGEDLAADLGASANRDEGGRYTGVFQLARALTLAGAAHAGVLAIDTIYADFRDTGGLEAECKASRRDGFTAKMAIHPAQVEIINAALAPSQEAMRRAERIVALFEDHPDAGVVSLDGGMVDRPHLKQAERLLRGRRA